MTTRTFNANIGGRVSKIKADNFLIPLYEAISNSIHAIDATQTTNGTISVALARDPRQGDLAASGNSEATVPITGFLITDNGIGFDNPNMESFLEADSRFKARLGGKGVGRFTWLKFFEKATVESVFLYGAKQMRRRFTFSKEGVEEEDLVEVSSAVYTKVSLAPLDVTYESKARKSVEEVAINIIEHFLVYLVTGAMPKLMLKDGAAEIDIRDFYQRSIGKHESKDTFVIKNVSFECTGIRVFLGNPSHTIFLCGDKRASEKVLLARKDPFFAKRFLDDDLREYAYQMIIQSEFLDRIVNDDREGFRFPEPGSLDSTAGDVVTREELLSKAIDLAKTAMATEIDKIKDNNLKTVSHFVTESAPQYRYILTKHKEEAATIHDVDPQKIDQALRKIQFKEELRNRADIEKLLKQAEQSDEATKVEWHKNSAEVMARLSEAGKASLASYIVQRKLILDLLKRRLDLANGSHAREEAVHQLIFPMRSTSDEVGYEEQNLWIIDERLSYHYYLASDKPLKSIDPAQSASAKEPDIIVFNRPIALNDRPEQERLESIVIIEFKRPGESAVDGQKNPVDQILEYIELIGDGRAQTRAGRPLTATEGTYFFGYAVCELDPLLKKVLIRKTMRATPDGRGMFGFFPDHKAYIEVISYEKMLDDAWKRNRILFDKLQLPPQ